MPRPPVVGDRLNTWVTSPYKAPSRNCAIASANEYASSLPTHVPAKRRLERVDAVATPPHCVRTSMHLRRVFSSPSGSLIGTALWLLACLIALLLAASVVGAQSLSGATVAQRVAAAGVAGSPPSVGASGQRPVSWVTVPSASYPGASVRRTMSEPSGFDLKMSYES